MLLLLVTKYKSRHNWNHKKVLRYCHPKMTGDEAFAKNIVMQYATHGYSKVRKYEEDKTLDSVSSEVMKNIKVLEEIKKLQPGQPEDVARLLEILKLFVKKDVSLEFNKCSFRLAHEHLPSGFLKLKDVSFNSKSTHLNIVN